ncbi:Putative rhamnogalacturonase [Fulvia fulva]|uniref:Rhamnogalacturonate lyase n=1 Tax=Passalora fulva TaxID=5499 RepID=A0A9Q8PKE0_PASFU|nr:Putative rhamnogalacturonase [Fulvia fulva]KAK4612291.1 putative rhamnogalacturonase [Fulvia fulva]KAK4612350.1 putative rhamnogalacturonase [Fulvia fulva]UJO24073.1 Putative rhamnogalacturonase [Fulvia fulva]WPV21614.1 Putative rhamnogalacturonase [Fulvia fulva]WPV36131.1 Putative rhamnogalacturonase [Fulvia fulva]
MSVRTLLLGLLSLASTAFAAFGYTESSASFVVDAGSANSLVVTIEKSSCDVTSIVYRGVEIQSQTTGTHIGSGLGTATVSADTIDEQYIKVTCETDTLTQYLVFVSGDSNIYLATYITAEPSVGELRYIARLDSSVLPSEYPFGEVSTTKPSTSTIEGSDVFVVDGETRSKFYSSERFIDDHVHCVYGDDIHACFVKPVSAYETSSGGPFFRDINSNNGGDYTSLTFYMNSGHVQTEDRRMGLYGPYALTFSRSGIPKLADFDLFFFVDLDIEGYVPASGRGYVSGTASGVPSDFQPVIHWFNSAAQYWTYASSSGTFTSPAMKPGTYTMKLYRTELEVASQSVTVSAGATKTSNIASTLSNPATSLWTIGTCDGQPTGLLNADKQLRMHPSDSRMSDWAPGTFTVGTSSDSSFPMALFKDINSPQTLSFNLDDASAGATLRIRTTLAFASGRPQITVNDWTSEGPAAPVKIDSRGVTRGAYRGCGESYEFEVPEGELVEGANTVAIRVISGSSGEAFLSPNFIVDCIEMYR